MRLKGENDAATAKGSFGAARLKDKIKIMLAGVVVNFVVAVLLFTLLALIGMPKLIDNQFAMNGDTKVVSNEVRVGLVEPGSPAEKAGLLPNDQLLAIEGNNHRSETITSSEVLPVLTKERAGQEIHLQLRRGDETKDVHLTLRSENEVDASKNSDEPKGYLGITPTEYTLQRSTWSAPIVGLGTTLQFSKLTYQGLGNLLKGLVGGNASQASDQVSGPVGIFVLLREGSNLGIRFVLMIIAVISLTLAIMNSLPIPALDGGRLFVTLLYRALKKPLTKQAEERIHGTGFLVLMGVFVLITIVDIRRFF